MISRCLLSLGLLVALLASGRGEEERYTPFADATFPFFGLSVDASLENSPRSNWVPRGVVVRLADDFWALYDVDLVRLAAVWRGSFPRGVTIAQESYQNTKKKAGGGQKAVPRFDGEVLLANAMLPGMWTGKAGSKEDPRDQGPDERELGRGPVDFAKYARWRGVEADKHGAVVVYEVAGGTVRERVAVAPGGRGFQRRFSYEGLKEKVFVANGTGVAPIVLGPGSRADLEGLGGSKIRWAEEITVQAAERAGGRDRIPLPAENPWRRPVRPTAIAFYEDGRAAIATVDGDVWIATGLDNTLGSVAWRRFACGLHEPYSIEIRDGQIFVFDRGGLKRLHDRDGDGEAEYHEWFCHDFWQSAETRDFPHDMALRADGGFYLVKGGQQNDYPSKHSGRVLSVSADGEHVEVFSSGHRNAFLGLHRDTGELFACDQQGHWVPATPIQRLQRGGYYGFQPAAPHGVPEPSVARPLTWVPHRAAQSAVDLIPMTDGSLVCVDYFRPGLLKIYPSGAAARLGEAWKFPLLKGAVSPVDGHLYVVGFQIWGTAAKDDAGFGRLRVPESTVPKSVSFGSGGVVLEFERESDTANAEKQHFHAASWSYRRSADYGSGYYRADGSPGKDPLVVAGAHRSKDGRRMFVHLPKLAPAQQLALGYDFPPGGGKAVAGEVYFSPEELEPLDLEALGFASIDLKAEAAASEKMVAGSGEAKATVERGVQLSLTFGCIACHSIDGASEGKSGPTWKGLAGSRREFIKGAPIESADAKYLREAILDPADRVVKGYNPKDVGMPSYRGILSGADVESLVMYIDSLGG